MRKKSSKIVILYLIISLVAGIGIGFAGRSSQVNSLKDDAATQAAVISTLNGNIANLEDRISRMTTDLQQKQADYDLLTEESNKLTAELQTLQTNYDNLLNESTAAQVIKLKEQISALTADKISLNAQLASLQLQSADLQGSLNGISDLNATLRDINTKLTSQITQLTSDNTALGIQVNQLIKKTTPSPDRALDPLKVWGNPVYKSTDWVNRDYELQNRIEEIGQTYAKNHIYIAGDFDCNDMAVDLWDLLKASNIKSVIVVGNLNITVKPLFNQLTHAWLDIFDGSGRVIYMEATTGKVIYGQKLDGTTNPAVIPYREGYMYDKPSDLRADVKDLW